MAGRVPENTLLSHDLFEGMFARAALASDIEVVEDFPARYDVDIRRQHRWARGDWQLLPWIFGQRRSDLGGIPPVGRWKMMDNLRRSLLAPMAMLALFAGWMLPLPLALLWTVLVAAMLAMPRLLPLPFGLLPARAGRDAAQPFRGTGCRRADRVRPDRPQPGVSGRCRRDHARCDPAHGMASGRVAPASAGMDDGCADRQRRAPHACPAVPGT